MLIDIGVYKYIFALIVPIIVGFLLLIKRQRVAKILLLCVISYVFTVAILNNIFPLRFGELVGPSEEKMWFGFVSPLFAGFDIRYMSITILFPIYWQGIIFGVFLGFLITLSIKSARSIIGCVISNVLTELILILALVIPNLFSFVSKYALSTQFLMSFIFYFIGYGLAKLSLKLSPEMLKYIDSEKKEKSKKINEKLKK